MSNEAHPTDPAPYGQSHLSRRSVLAGLTLGAVVVPQLVDGALLAPPAAAAPRADDPEVHLVTRELDVTIGTAFPRIARYEHRASGSVLQGQPNRIDSVVINGEERTPHRVDFRRMGRWNADYTLHFDGGGSIVVRISVDRDRADWRVRKINETDDFRVGTLDVPGLVMLRVDEGQPGATVRTAKIDLDLSREGDTSLELAGSQLDEIREGCAYGVLHTDALAAGIESNSVVDRVSEVPDSAWENARLWRHTGTDDGVAWAGLSPGQWTHRADGATEVEPLPYVRVIVTADRNDDGVVDWQDAAIALRSLLPQPLGMDSQHLRVVPHIPYLNSSLAENNFLKILENVKRVSLSTDGLGQYTLIKGYQGEGHDCAHPDYGGHYNERAGGLEHLNQLLRSGKDWNSWFGVHVNATEAYPEAHHFSEDLVHTDWLGWNGKDVSYRINTRWDRTSGNIEQRFQDLRDETDPALSMLYIDVFRESGWPSDVLQHRLREQGWIVTTEWGHGLERSAVWAHWATDINYGGDASRGVNSTMARFLMNHYKDVFAGREPRLGVPRTYDFEGWQNRTNWYTFYRGIWENNLPAKFLQAHPMVRLTDSEIRFADGTTVTGTGADRVVVREGHEVLRGHTYLLPWEPRASRPEKLYHYNPDGGATTWAVPSSWSELSRVAVHRLTDTGPRLVDWVPVTDGQISLTADAGQPYVIRPEEAEVPDPLWGEGTGLQNPFFTPGDLRGWQTTGSSRVELSERGQYEVQLGDDGAAASIRQPISGLEPGGRYAASVLVQIGEEAGETRRTTLTVDTPDGPSSTHLDRSTLSNTQNSDVKKGTRFHRIWTYFTAPTDGSEPELTIDTVDGTAQVLLDHVRVAPGRQPALPDGAIVAEDFEHVPFGYGVFVSCNIRSHLSEVHEPYTSIGWNGKELDDVLDGSYSLKTRATGATLQYRSLPSNIRFRPGHRYRVEFDYQSRTEADWVTGVDEPASRDLRADRLPRTTGTQRWRYEFTAPETGDAWIGLRSQIGDSTEVVIDNLVVYELD